MVIALVLWALTWFLNRALYAHPTKVKHPEELRARDFGRRD